jgi:golgin subfamily B member 1
MTFKTFGPFEWYKGDWEYDRFHGEGKLKDRINEYIIEGTWHDGIQTNRQGDSCKWTDEEGMIIFEGEWDGKTNTGNGTLRYKHGGIYKGELHGNKRHGQGIMSYRNGKQRNGDWSDDKYISNTSVVKYAQRALQRLKLNK